MKLFNKWSPIQKRNLFCFEFIPPYLELQVGHLIRFFKQSGPDKLNFFSLVKMTNFKFMSKRYAWLETIILLIYDAFLYKTWTGLHYC